MKAAPHATAGGAEASESARFWRPAAKRRAKRGDHASRLRPRLRQPIRRIRPYIGRLREHCVDRASRPGVWTAGALPLHCRYGGGRAAITAAIIILTTACHARWLRRSRGRRPPWRRRRASGHGGGEKLLRQVFEELLRQVLRRLVREAEAADQRIAVFHDYRESII
jgi:hypothetical protein